MQLKNRFQMATVSTCQHADFVTQITGHGRFTHPNSVGARYNGATDVFSVTESEPNNAPGIATVIILPAFPFPRPR